VGLVLEDAAGRRQIVWGDCVGVAYSGKAGRDPVFRAAEGLAIVRQVVAPALEGREVAAFRPLAGEMEALIAAVDAGALRPEPDAAPKPLSRREVLSPARLLHSLRQEVDRSLIPEAPPAARGHHAVRYGISQALLAATALAQGVTMAEVIAAEWGLPLPAAPVPIHAQSGAERMANADKMIVRRVASLPHALVDDIPQQVGEDGAKLVQYVRWLAERIPTLGGPEYRPTIHLDVHGALGRITRNEAGRVLGHLHALEQAARPYPLRVECPVMLDSRAEQIAFFKRLREYIRLRGMRVQIAADEWANTLEDIRAFVEAQAADMIQIKMPDLGGVQNAVEAVLACKAGGVEAFLGGSCCETDLSARVSVHVALATQPALLMAKPGMGVDEAVMLAHNEMARTLAWIRVRKDLH
jgi:methylaspartate ammonia-lyase